MFVPLALRLFAAAALLLTVAVLSQSSAEASAGDAPPVIPLWPHGAPDEGDVTLGQEHDTSKPTDRNVEGRAVVRIGDVSTPTITVYRAAKDKATGTAVLVCPGGGYNILAWDLEGVEVCEWLNRIGVTAILLKYRVPRRPGREPYAAPLQDAQRAMGLVRSRANEWGIQPDRIGILGFSAGGHLSAALSTNYETRTYAPVDAADSVSCKPNFAILIYPAYLTQPADTFNVSPELHITAATPPTFLAQTGDDNGHVTGTLGYYAALRTAHVPAEIHLYPSGGHGYGLRPSEHAPIADAWPRLAEAWLRHNHMLGTHL